VSTLTFFLLICFGFLLYLGDTNTSRADSRRLKSGCFTIPKNYILPAEWGYREVPTTLEGGRNSAGIFAFGGFTMSILSSKNLPYPVSPAASESCSPAPHVSKKRIIRFVGGLACCGTSRALVSSLRPADNFPSDRRPHPSPFSTIPTFFFSPATQFDDGQHQSTACRAGSRHQQTLIARELTMRAVNLPRRQRKEVIA